MPQRPLIIDCDPGVDDAIALLLAIASPELQLLGITTVAGNVPIETTQTNARKICELANRPDIPVYAGCPRPLVRTNIFAEAIHGNNGLGGVKLPTPKMPLQIPHAVSYLIEQITQAPAPVTLAVLGPMTNLAVALVQAPRIALNIHEIVVMGGAIGPGNVTPFAEFNLYADPHAAHVVFTSGIPLTLIPLDVTHLAIATPERKAQIQALKTPVSKVVVKLLSHYAAREQTDRNWTGPPLHDPCVIAYLLQPNLFQVQSFTVSVELADSDTLGQTRLEPLPKKNSGHRNIQSIQVAQQIDADRFYALLTKRIGQL